MLTYPDKTVATLIEMGTNTLRKETDGPTTPELQLHPRESSPSHSSVFLRFCEETREIYAEEFFQRHFGRKPEGNLHQYWLCYVNGTLAGASLDFHTLQEAFKGRTPIIFRFDRTFPASVEKTLR